MESTPAQSFVTLNTAVGAQVAVGQSVFWAGTALFGLAIAKDSGWTGHLGNAGVVIGIVLIATVFVTIPWIAVQILAVLAGLWFVMVGRGLGQKSSSPATGDV